MNKLRGFLALTVLVGALSPVFASGADIVVLMDSSGTILPYFEDINGKILVDITRKFIREGDTFHLISFNSRTNLEIAQPIESEADISRIVSRFMLLYPLGQNSDFLSGLQYTLQYVSSLDPQKQKIIIVISDGIFNPPESSPYASLTPDKIKAEISGITTRIRGAGWNVYYIKLPFPENAEVKTLDGNLLTERLSGTITEDESKTDTGPNSAHTDASTPVTHDDSGKTSQKAEATQANEVNDPDKIETKQYYDVSAEFASDLSITPSSLPSGDIPIAFVDQVFSIPQISFPRDLGKKGRFFVLPLKVANDSDSTVNMELTEVRIPTDVNVLAKTSFLTLGPRSSGTLRAEINLPDTVGIGPQDLSMTLGFSDNLRVSPQTGIVRLTVTAFSFDMLFRTGGAVVLTVLFIILAIILIALLFAFIVRRTSRPATDVLREANAIGGVSVPPEAGVSRPAHHAPKRQMPMNAAERLSPATAQGLADASGREALASYAETSASKTLSAESMKPTPVEASDRISAPTREARMSRDFLAPTGKKDSREEATILSTFSKNSATKERGIDKAYAEKTDISKEIESVSGQLSSDRGQRLAVLSAAAKRPSAPKAGITGATSGEPIAVRGNARVMLELFVDRQNMNIGKRNIHMMKAGSRLAIGGGQSPFLIFLVKFPPHIAEIRFDGERCDLAILKPEFFPNETENVIRDCVGRSFKVVSNKGYELCFELRTYEDPVLALNRMLTSIRF